MKWEYTEEETYINFELNVMMFNGYGKLGWECYAVDEGKAYFKRPLEDYGEEETLKEETTQENPCQTQRVATAGELYANAYGFR